MALGDPFAVLAALEEPTTSFLLPSQLRRDGRRAVRLPVGENWLVGAMVFDSLGRTLFSNGALRDLLTWDPERKKLTAALEDRGELFSRAARRVPGVDSPAPSAHGSSAVRTARADYRLLPIVVGLDTGPGAPFFAILVERIALRDEVSQQRRTSVRLTPREVQVAQLLCLGRNNAEIAMTICVSLSTARRHVEHIFAKLGIHRRAEVLARLLS